MAGPLHASPMALPRPAEEGIMRRFALRGEVPAELRLPPMAQRFRDASAALAEALDSKLHPPTHVGADVVATRIRTWV